MAADSFRFAAWVFIPAFEPIAVLTVIQVFHLPLGHSCIMDLKIYHQIESIIEDVLPIASYDITPELVFSDFGISPGDPEMQKFRFELEDVFYPVEISNEEFEKFLTVSYVVSYISKKTKRNNSGW